MFESRISAGATEKLPGWEKTSRAHCSVVLRHGGTRSKKMRWAVLWIGKQESGAALQKVSNPCVDDHQFKQEELESVVDFVRSFAHKLSWNAKTWHELEDLTSYGRSINLQDHTNDFRQHCHVGNTAQHCRLGLFQDSDFAGDLKDSKSTSGGVLCIFGSRTHVPVSWMCKKQIAVSRSCTESEIISLDAGLRMDVLPALDLLDIVFEVLRSTKTLSNPNILASRKLVRQFKNQDPECQNKNWMMWIMYPQTHILLRMSLSCRSLKTTKPWSKW